MTRKGTPRTCEGSVVSDRMDKTVVVEVERLIAHPLYGKRLRRASKFKAHDEKNEWRIGDRVQLAECRPLIKDKNWRVIKVLTAAE